MVEQTFRNFNFQIIIIGFLGVLEITFIKNFGLYSI